jgi:hypothetical protein
MVQRLAELYPKGERVEIRLRDEAWYAGLVVRHDHPGVWVHLDDGSQWFVTNRRSIRPAPEGADEINRSII